MLFTTFIKNIAIPKESPGARGSYERSLMVTEVVWSIAIMLVVSNMAVMTKK